MHTALRIARQVDPDVGGRAGDGRRYARAHPVRRIVVVVDQVEAVDERHVEVPGRIDRAADVVRVPGRGRQTRLFQPDLQGSREL